MTFKTGPRRYAGDPGYDGIVVVMLKGEQHEKFARTDGKRIGYGQRTPEEAEAIELDEEGRLPPHRVCPRQRLDYWKTVTEDVEPEVKPEPPKLSWMAQWAAAVKRLLGR